MRCAARPVDEPALPQLTRREYEVLDLIASGLGNAATATRLGVAPNTVRNHIANIFDKLQVASRAEAIIRARSAGLGSTGNSGEHDSRTTTRP